MMSSLMLRKHCIAKVVPQKGRLLKASFIRDLASWQHNVDYASCQLGFKLSLLPFSN